MTALEFMREVVRMCRSCENCSQCVIDGYESCLWIDGDFSPEKFVQDVEQWAKEKILNNFSHLYNHS